MDIVYEIGINLVCSLVAFLLGIVVHKFTTKYKQSGKLTIWKLLQSDKDCSVCLTIRDGPRVTSTPRTSIAEVIAMSEALPLLRSMNISYRIVDNYSNFDLSRCQSILCIGGPRSNQMTAKLWDTYKMNLPLKLSLDNESARFEIGSKVYTTQYTADGSKLMTDYGVVLVICESNTHESKKCRILAFGCRGLGTYGTVLSISNPQLVKRYKKFMGKSFLSIIRINVDNNDDDIRTSVEEFYPLDNFD